MYGTAKSSSQRTKPSAVIKMKALAGDITNVSPGELDQLPDTAKTVWVQNGRMVSLTVHHPQVRKELKELLAAQRKDIDALKEFYVTNGFLTAGGKLTKRYGG